MMKVFDIITAYTYSQTHCVVAKTMGDAERIYKDKYQGTVIKEIRLHSEYVHVQKELSEAGK